MKKLIVILAACAVGVAFALAFYARQRIPQEGSSAAVTVFALKGGETAPSIMRRKSPGWDRAA